MAAYVRRLRGWKRLVARFGILSATAVAALLTFVLWIVLVDRLVGEHHSWVSLAVNMLGRIVIFAGAGSLGWLAFRLTAPTADESLRRDTRPPVVYLRPFGEDNRVLARGGVSTVTADSILGGVLRDIGPFIAVARPNDIAPMFGVASLAVEAHIDWKALVEQWLGTARLVIVQAGAGDGLRWELDAARRICDPERLLVSFLGWQGLKREERERRHTSFRSLAELALGLRVPVTLDRDLFWSFDGRWRLLQSTRPHWTRALLGQTARTSEGVRETLRSVLTSRGIRLRLRRTIIAGVFIPALLAAALVLAMVSVTPYITGEAARRARESEAMQLRLKSALREAERRERVMRESAGALP